MVGAFDYGKTPRSKVCGLTLLKTEPAGKSSGEFIDLGALGSGGSRFEVRLELGGGVLLHQARC